MRIKIDLQIDTDDEWRDLKRLIDNLLGHDLTPDEEQEVADETDNTP